LYFFNSFSQSLVPRSRLILRCLAFKYFLICWRAEAVATQFNQLRCGLRSAEVMISTISPLFNAVLIGIISPLILASLACKPISVWILKAKSRAVAPGGRLMTLPLGVKA